jgi:uncharacterized Zn-finger protein
MSIAQFFFFCGQCSTNFTSSKIFRNHGCGLDKIKLDDRETKNVKVEFKRDLRDTVKEETFKETKTIEKKPSKKETKHDPNYIKTDITGTTHPFPCDLCTKRLSSEEALRIHKEIHKLDPKIPCRVQACGQIFSRQKLLQDHMASAHSMTNEDMSALRLKCEHCEKTFDVLSRLKVHMVKHSTDKQFQCTMCPKQFKFKESFLNHTKNHQGIFDHQCKDCDKRYTSYASLHGHRNTFHVTERRFTCEHCGNEYKTNGRLSVHRTIHTGEKRYQCREGCEKMFRLHRARDGHERMHRGVREFQCTACTKMFIKKQNLTVHMKRHEGKKDHKCETCDKAFVEPAGARNCKHSQIQNQRRSVDTIETL